MEFNRKIITLAVGLCLVFSNYVYAHSGGTNKNGCHNDNINGGYHCHNSKKSSSEKSSSDSDGDLLLILAVLAIPTIIVAYRFFSSSKSNLSSNYLSNQHDKINNSFKLSLAPISKTEFGGVTIQLSYAF